MYLKPILVKDIVSISKTSEGYSIAKPHPHFHGEIVRVGIERGERLNERYQFRRALHDARTLVKQEKEYDGKRSELGMNQLFVEHAALQASKAAFAEKYAGKAGLLNSAMQKRIRKPLATFVAGCALFAIANGPISYGIAPLLRDISFFSGISLFALGIISVAIVGMGNRTMESALSKTGIGAAPSSEKKSGSSA